MAAPLPFPADHLEAPPAPKSAVAAVLLAVLFGPVGLFYSSVAGGVFTLFLAVVLGLFTVGLGLVPVWILCGVWAYVAVHHHAPRPEP